MYTRNLSQGDCKAMAEEVERIQPGAKSWYNRREPLCARLGCGSLPGRRRV